MKCKEEKNASEKIALRGEFINIEGYMENWYEKHERGKENMEKVK